MIMIINFHTDFISLGCLHPGAFSLRAKSIFSSADAFVPPSFHARLPSPKSVRVFAFRTDLGEAGRGSQAIAGRVADKCPKGTAASKSAKYTKGKPQLNRISILSTFSAATRQRLEGGVEIESNPARIAVNLHIVQNYLSALVTLQAPPYLALYLEQWTNLNHLIIFGKLKFMAK